MIHVGECLFHAEPAQDDVHLRSWMGLAGSRFRESMRGVRRQRVVAGRRCRRPAFGRWMSAAVDAGIDIENARAHESIHGWVAEVERCGRFLDTTDDLIRRKIGLDGEHERNCAGNQRG